VGEVPGVVSDPIGVMVGLIAEVDAGIDREVVG
jgi:hypothetical protein